MNELSLKEKNLVKILSELVHPVKASEEVAYPTYQEVKVAGYIEFIEQAYADLGGLGKELPFKKDSARIQFPDFVIELDDEAHFNRYRLVTLRSEVYNRIPGFPSENYKLYCRRFEKECLKSGIAAGKWTNGMAEVFFGPAAEPGDFFINGSPVWKLRAFNDFIHDLLPLCKKTKLLRLSIYDEVLLSGKRISIDKILLSPKAEWNTGFLKYMERRIAALNNPSVSSL